MMRVKATQQLRQIETLHAKVRNFIPTNEIERETRRLLLEVIRSRCLELQRELFKSRKLGGWPLKECKR